jgi:hypothetical protein
VIDMGDTNQSAARALELGPYGCSWTAYVAPLLTTLVFVAIGLAVYAFSPLVGALWITFFLLLFLYGALTLRSIKIYADADGVWVYRGILPWNKGQFGVKWRDLDEATYTQGFFGWLFKSYSLRIGHRFTKSSEILLGHIKHGDRAVMAINERHLLAVRSGDLRGS